MNSIPELSSLSTGSQVKETSTLIYRRKSSRLFSTTQASKQREILFAQQHYCLLSCHPCVRVCVHAKSFQSCLTFCDPMIVALQAPLSVEVIQARILEWVAKPSSRGSSRPRNRTCVSHVSCVGRKVLYP